MSCIGSHLGFWISIKNINFLEDLLGMSFTKFFFYADRKSKMATTAGHRLTLNPMGKCSNAFFSETTNQTESKLDRNEGTLPARFGLIWFSNFRGKDFEILFP
jgi:hypothetical protein